MRSISARFNRIVFFGLLTLAFMSAINYLTALYLIKDKHIDAEFEFDKHLELVKFEGRQRGAQWDKLTSTFNLKLNNLKNLDNWNLKQFFIYLEATWEEKGKRNEAIFWDKIIRRSELTNSVVVTGQKIKYPICDINFNLKKKVINVNVWIEQVPIFGWIHRRKYGSFQTLLPSGYF